MRRAWFVTGAKNIQILQYFYLFYTSPENTLSELAKPDYFKI